MRIRFLYLYFLLFWNADLFCRNVSDSTESRYIGSIPFQTLSGGVLMVVGSLDGWKDSLHFILDTGSGAISIDATKSASMGFVSNESSNLSGIGGQSAVPVSHLHTLHLNGISTPDLNFHVYDYRLLSSIYGVQIDGVIGYAFFSKYIIHLDHEKSLMSIFSIGKFPYPKRGQLLQIGEGNIPTYSIVTAEKKKSKHRFYFDSGAGLALLLNSDYSTDSAVFSGQKKFYTTRAEGVGGKKQMQLTTIKRMSFGPFVFKNVPTYVFNDENNVTDYPNQGGLVGNEILRRFNIILNYSDHVIHVVPNIHFNDPFEYGYSGFSMLLDGEEIVVEDVIADSPAFLAGLQSGDVIIGINGDFSGNIQRYRSMIQDSEKPVKLLIRRNGTLSDVSFRPISIL
ncbi:MAG: hypothetical protein RL582_25 [Bacteroidota bacterium]